MAQKAVFFDRDDTLVNDPGYIQRPDQILLLPGAAEALIQLRKMGYLLIIVTNQSGVARGLITEEQLEGIHRRLKKLFAAEGAEIDDIYYCPYHPEGTVNDFSIESNLRKPNAGMFFQAEKDHDVNLEQSWMIGDSYRDIKAGKAAGCHTILVDVPGKIREKKADDPEPDRKAVNLREAVNIIRMHEFHQKAQAAKKTPVETQTSEELEEEPEQGVSEQQTEPETPVIDSEPPDPADPGSEPDTTAVIKTEQGDIPVDEPAKFYTAKPQPQTVPAQETHTHEKTHHLLEQMLQRLKSREREGLYQEFSVFKLLSLLFQVVSVFCLITSVCFWLSRKASTDSVIIMIGYAVALQLLVIALLLMHSRE